MPGSSPDVIVLLDLRLAGVSDVARVAERTEIAPATVERILLVAETDGLVRHSTGEFGGFRLTSDGRTALGRLLRDELEATGVEPGIRAAYRRFLEVNRPFLEICTRWQLRPAPGEGREVVNDHGDEAYDREVVDALAAIHDVVRPVTVDLASLLDRMASYPRRLDYALAKVQAGALDWFTRPGIDSYHSVWFELHADLLATLGIERADELADDEHERNDD